MNKCPTYKMLESEPTVAHAATASDTLSFILIIAVMAILLIRIKDDNIAVAYCPRENHLTNVLIRKLNKALTKADATFRPPPYGGSTLDFQHAKVSSASLLRYWRE